MDRPAVKIEVVSILIINEENSAQGKVAIITFFNIKGRNLTIIELSKFNLKTSEVTKSLRYLVA